MAVLVRCSLEEVHCGHFSIGSGFPEVRQVILVVGLVGFSDHRYRSGRQVVWIGSGLVVLKRLVVRDVVGDCVATDILVS